MLEIDGYYLDETLHHGLHSLVYRARRKSDEQSIILKALRDEYPSTARIAWFRREFEVTRNLDLDGVIDAYRLANVRRRWIMELEDFGGESLTRLELAGQIDLDSFLHLASRIASVLGQIHQRHIIHKDINPSNIVFNPATGIVKLIDFGIATEISHENPTFRSPNALEGTLLYISPEQTGRMNRALDYRTDFYSLGITFYQLLTGDLPFASDDALELVHSHIARQPPSPRELRPDVPAPVSDLIMRLMSKNAEARYQSARKLEADLHECLRQRQSTGHIAPFPLGERDIPDRFEVSRKLYGRQREIELLMAAFARVAGGANEMMLVSGYSGVGKSALVQELYRPVTEQRGHFLSGKFDQFQRNIPYTSIIQAFRSLVRQLLTEDEARVAAWKDKLSSALGSNGQVIVEVIPEIALIIGPQPDVPALGPTEAQNRFNLVFQNFIEVFARPEHSLVLFLDDLQWADSASLKLLEVLITGGQCSHLFVIGAYRDNEVGDVHPLILMIKEIEKSSTIVHTLRLSPLELEHVTELISDTLHSPADEVAPLAALAHGKTHGNPFFLGQFLSSLHAEKLITFDHAQGEWTWDLMRINRMQITDNVVELLISKVKKLPAAAQEALKLAACIGSQVDLEILARIFQKSHLQAAHALGPAITEGMLVPLSDAYKLMEMDVQGLSDEVTAEYRFAHDRVQQAAYSLIPDADKQRVHLRVGQLLLEGIPENEREERIFDIVNHLNYGRALLAGDSERDELIRLNLAAGKKARASMAYGSAIEYLDIGIELLARDDREAAECWEHQYELALELHVQATEAAYLTGDYDRMEECAQIVLESGRSDVDRARVHEVRIQSYLAQTRLLDAIHTSLEALRLLGITFPDEPSFADLGPALEAAKAQLAGRAVQDLSHLPLMTDPAKLAAMRILASLSSASYKAAPQLLPLCILKQVGLSIEYGNAPGSIHGYVTYGLLLCGIVGDIDLGYQFGQLAFELLERLDAREFKASTCNVGSAAVRPWKEHTRDTLRSAQEGFQAGLETGAIEMGCYCALVYTFNAFAVGNQLGKLEREIAAYSEAMLQLKQTTVYNPNELWRQVVLNLMGKTADPERFSGEAYDENALLPVHLSSNDRSTIYYLYLNKLMLHYLFHVHEFDDASREEYDRAIGLSQAAEEYIDGALGMQPQPLFYFYDSLMRLALYSHAHRYGPDGAKESKRFLDKVAANQEKMANWARHAPMNFAHKYLLVAAERKRVEGKQDEARRLYTQAIRAARTHEYLNEEALACELAARFRLRLGQDASGYLRDASYAYSRWGAIAKVRDLERRFPQVFKPASIEQSLASVQHTTTTPELIESALGNVLDLTSVLRASQLISQEIILDKLLDKLMRLVLENAGAQQATLLLRHEGELRIEAEGRAGDDDIRVLQSISVDRREDLPVAVIKYVERTGSPQILDDASADEMFSGDPYIARQQPRSILCMPLIHQGKVMGVLYLENNLAPGVFTSDRLHVLDILSTQATISIENAKLYRERQQAEEAVRKSRRQLAQFLEAIPVGVLVLDTDAAPYYANETAQQLLGRGIIPSGAEGRPVHASYLADTSEPYPAECLPTLRALRGDSTTIADMEIQHPDRRVPVEVTATPIFEDNGSIMYAIGVFQDITQRKQSEKILADYNRTLERQVEQRTQELKEKNQELETALEQLRATQQQLIVQEKLASLGSMTAGIAHELRNPLNFVINFANTSQEFLDELDELLDCRGSSPAVEDLGAVVEILDSLKQNAQIIAQHGARAGRIIDSMLIHSRESSGGRQPTQINGILEQYIELAHKGMLAQEPSFRMEVVTHFDTGLAAVEMVPQDFSRVVLNMVSNACYALHEKQKQTGPEYQPTLTVSTQDLGDRVRISVRDNGTGIPESDREKIFHPFFTTKPAGLGTGLGLSISYDLIVHKHKGSIEVNSEEGSHTEFIIFLPK